MPKGLHLFHIGDPSGVTEPQEGAI
jgi:hypothetical protein